MSKPKPFNTWVIRNKETGEYFVAPSGKNAWKQQNHAKNAWASIGAGAYIYSLRHTEKLEDLCNKYKVKESTFRGKPSFPYFDEQDVWECVEILGSVEEMGTKLKKADEIINSIYMSIRCGEPDIYGITSTIEEYMKNNWRKEERGIK